MFNPIPGHGRLPGRAPVAALAALALVSGVMRVRAADPSGLLRLLVPLDTGLEHGRLVSLYPEAQMVNRDGRDFLVIGSYNDARIAYRAGRRLQQTLPVRFVITYPPRHPQADGRWIPSEAAAEAEADRAASRVARLAEARAADIAAAREAANPSRAGQLGAPLEAKSPLLVAASVAPRGLVSGATPQEMEALVKDEAQATSIHQHVPQQQAPQPALRAARVPVEIPVTAAPLVANPAPEPAPALIARSEPPLMPVREPARPQTPELALASPPPARRRFNLVAVNPELRYLFAKLESQEQLEALKQRLAVSEVVERDGQILAQVGIYTTSRKGGQLLRERQEQLSAAGLQFEQMGAT